MPHTELTPNSVPGVSESEKSTLLAYFLAHLPRDDSENATCGRNLTDPVQYFVFSIDPLLSSCLMNFTDDDVKSHIESYLNLPPNSAVNHTIIPLRYIWLGEVQDANQDL